MVPVDPETGKATAIHLTRLSSPHMRTFHLTWFAFFLCFFAWFGIAPFMPAIRDEMGLTKDQVGNLIIGSVAMTVVGRLVIGWVCDRWGPRLAYTALLCVGSIPVMCVGFAQSYESLLIFRILIGGIGASFVITQYHTSLTFAPNCVGTANATTAGWGNLGGGVANMLMPLLLAFLLWFGLDVATGWRVAMLVAGIVCCAAGVLYFFATTDTPRGNLRDLRARGEIPPRAKAPVGEVLRDYRVWVLFLVYAACFGVELTINGVAAMYYFDRFELDLRLAGLVAGLFGLMNLFARTMGGFFGDRLGRKWGLRGRVRWLVVALLGEAIALACFSQMTLLPIAVGSMIVFSLFVQMSEGATYSVVPFINKRGLGLVAGIVGAGGNLGAVSAGFLFKGSMDYATALFALSFCVGICGLLAATIRFKPREEHAARTELVRSVVSRDPDAIAA